MRSVHIFRLALLGSALAVAAFSPASSANLSRDAKRALAVYGHRLPTAPAKPGVATAAKSYTYTDLHDFAGGTTDGASPGAEVTLDSGNIYGTTDYGGLHGDGTIFEITSDGTEKLLYSFSGGDGSAPDGAVTITSKGDLYGTTSSGGSGGNGVIYKLSAKGKYTVLHANSSDDGSFMRGRLTRDDMGNLYGTALFGGVNDAGTVFEVAADGTFTVLHTFNGSDGEFPEHGVVRDSAGNLYGVTAFGGASDNGTVYKIALDGTFTTLYSFTGGADGGFLYGTVDLGKDGNLYGSTVDGGANGAGTVFKLTTGGKLTTLYNFTGGADGGSPNGDMLVLGKNLYSTADEGGDPNCGCGVIYEVTSKGKEKVLHTFVAATGGGYSAGLTPGDKGTLYGTTSSYGADGNGTVFSLSKK